MTKNIFKLLAFTILMSPMLLIASCITDEIPNEKGYELPVTVNVTRQGEPATRASYNGTTKKLSFSTGDKLFVRGNNATACAFAGMLEWQSGGTFSGTIFTEKEYTDTIDNLFTTTEEVNAILLPAGYETYNYFYIGESQGYNTYCIQLFINAFATSKVTAVEQFSDENGNYVSGTGFVLSPHNALLSFTITNLTPSTVYDVVVSDGCFGRVGYVTTDGSGNATFAAGVMDGTYSENLTLSVGGTSITLNLFGGTNTPLAAGKIYNITRSAVPAATGHALSAAIVGDVVGTDGLAYSGTYYNNLPTGVTAVAKVCYVSGDGHGLALAMADQGTMDWDSANSSCSNKTPTVTGCTWKLATMYEWNKMISAAGSPTALSDGFTIVGGTNIQSDRYYWSSTKYEFNYTHAYMYLFNANVWACQAMSQATNIVRACLSW